MRSASLALFAVWILSAAATAQINGAPATTAPVAPVPKADDQKPICIDQDPDTASRLGPRRVCHTRQEWSKLGGVPK
jgi:hypothetical protein